MSLSERKWATCAECGGYAITKYDPVRDVYDERTWLHLNREDWQDNPHNVVPIKVRDEAHERT